ncbi:uncharacterized protein [Miscanthus floridulus]|uniref:uncharacterized protein isoform X2 n=1 Tax=Miscanthus floridulus TaxID=154761 RepID=UPI003458FD2C
MPPHGDGDELPSFSPSIPHSTQDYSPKTPADPAAQIPSNTAMDMDLETLGCYYRGPSVDFRSLSSWLPPESPQIDWSEIINFAAPADAPEDRRPWSTDADMLGVNDAAAPQAAPPVPVGGGGHAAPWCATAGTTEIQHLEEEDAQRRFDSWKSDVEQRLLGEVDPLTVSDEKLVEAPAPAPAPEDGRPSDRDADTAQVNAAIEPVEEYERSPAQQAIFRWRSLTRSLDLLYERRFGSFKNGDELPGRFDIATNKPWSIVRFTGPDAKGRKPHQGRWKEKSMKGMRAVADPSPQPPEQQQQRYVGLKKTLELDDDGNGNKWRAHEYTPLVPSDDGSDKLIPADISLRVEFKEDEPLSSSSSKRSRSGAPKDGPKVPVKSAVWKHMTKVHVKVAANNADGSQRKKPCYKVMYAICHHCDKVFNADSGRHGTNNLSEHLDSCHCNCTHSH